jgi:hypothetical protein
MCNLNELVQVLRNLSVVVLLVLVNDWFLKEGIGFVFPAVDVLLRFARRRFLDIENKTLRIRRLYC